MRRSGRFPGFVTISIYRTTGTYSAHRRICSTEASPHSLRVSAYDCLIHSLSQPYFSIIILYQRVCIKYLSLICAHYTLSLLGTKTSNIYRNIKTNTTRGQLPLRSVDSDVLRVREVHQLILLQSLLKIREEPTTTAPYHVSPSFLPPFHQNGNSSFSPSRPTPPTLPPRSPLPQRKLNPKNHPWHHSLIRGPHRATMEHTLHTPPPLPLQNAHDRIP